MRHWLASRLDAQRAAEATSIPPQEWLLTETENDCLVHPPPGLFRSSAPCGPYSRVVMFGVGLNRGREDGGTRVCLGDGSLRREVTRFQDAAGGRWRNCAGSSAGPPDGPTQGGRDRSVRLHVPHRFRAAPSCGHRENVPRDTLRLRSDPTRLAGCPTTVRARPRGRTTLLAPLLLPFKGIHRRKTALSRPDILIRTQNPARNPLSSRPQRTRPLPQTPSAHGTPFQAAAQAHRKLRTGRSCVPKHAGPDCPAASTTRTQGRPSLGTHQVTGTHLGALHLSHSPAPSSARAALASSCSGGSALLQSPLDVRLQPPE